MFKMLYRKKIVRKIISDMNDKISPKIDVLQALQIIDKLGRNVTTTIVNCFRSYGFVIGSKEDDTLIFIIKNTVTDIE